MARNSNDVGSSESEAENTKESNVSWAEEVEGAAEEGWTKSQSIENPWQALARANEADGDDLRPWRNKVSSSPTRTRKKSKNKGDPKLREQRRINNSAISIPPKPVPKRGVRLGWSDEEDDEKQTIMPLSHQMGWDDPVPERSVPVSSGESGWDLPEPVRPSTGDSDDDWSRPTPPVVVPPPKTKSELPERLWEPTPGSAKDLKRKKHAAASMPPPARDPDHNADSQGPWRRDDGTLQDRFGNDIEQEDWSRKPIAGHVKSTDTGWGVALRSEVGWGDEPPEDMVEDSDGGQYEYLDVEIVPVPLVGLKVATEPAHTLDLLHLKHLELRQVDWDDVVQDDLDWLAESALLTNDAQDKDEQPGVVGLSIDRGNEEARGKPPALCFSTVERALLIRFPEKPVGPKASELLATITHSKTLVKAAFAMYEHVQLLYYHYNLHFAASYDLQETYVKSGLDFVLDTAFGIRIEREIWHEEGHVLALDAWASCLVAHAAALQQSFNPELPPIDTFELDAPQLRAVATGAAVAATLASMEQREHKGYIESARMVKGSYILTQGRYSTRARREDRVTLLLDDSSEWACRVWDADGRDIVVRPVSANQPALDTDSVANTPCLVRVAPHEPPQESARRQFARTFLRGDVDLEQSRVLRTLFLAAEEKEDEMPLALASGVKIESKLNAAQVEAIQKIFDNSAAVLVHGPPGSGKTTVIAHAAKAYLLSDSAPDATMMIVANSNAAIKQCAEALLKHRISAFRLVTSTEYYVGWHAHHYSTLLQRKLVRSDEIKLNTPMDELQAIFRGVRVILCTLATLATRKLDQLLAERKVGLVVADEASQIVWSTFLPALWKIRGHLRKAVFVGDSLQLPPYGSQQAPDMIRSVFEIEPRPKALAEVLLDTCYRLPVTLGEFVSDLVYKGALVSKHELLTWSCTRFIDVETGRETKVGVSWTNPQESVACKVLVEKYYSGSNYCIITPYDAQRDLIERELKAANLPYDGRVQSIDAAQGSEYDFVILSLVRSSRSMGFLADIRRMNVMLTRQRRGLCIVSHPRFLETAAAGSLVGQLAFYASNRLAFSEKLHIPFKDVLANIASVPMGST